MNTVWTVFGWMYQNQSYDPDDPRADDYGYVRLGSIREILEACFIHTRNREINIDEAVGAIEELLNYTMFEDCCSFSKQARAGVSDEKMKEYLCKFIGK